MLAVIIVAIVVGLYIINVLIPAILSHNLIFGKHKNLKELWENPKPKPYYAPTMDRMLKDCRFFTEELEAKEIYIGATDGKKLYGRLYAHDSKVRNKTVLFFHGFRTTALEAFAMTARIFYERGYDVLIVDERGHGKSQGRSGMGMLEKDDVWSWVNYVQAIGVDDIVVYGVSMGGAACAYASAVLNELNVRTIIIDSAFTSVRKQLAVEHKHFHAPDFIFGPMERWLCEFTLGMHIDLKATVDLSRITVPCFFIHEKYDPTVAVTECQELYESCESEKDMVIVEGSRHTFGFIDGGEELQNRVFGFIEKHL